MAFSEQINQFTTNLSPNNLLSSSFIGTIVYGFLFILGVSFLILFIKNLYKYRYRGAIYRRRQNSQITGRPQSILVEGKAAYVKSRGLDAFRIKWGFFPWQSMDILKLPDPEHMTGNKAIFLQYNIGEVIQARQEIDWNKSTMKITPVDSTTKSAAKIEMNAYSNILSTRKLLQENAGIAIMGFILIAGIIAMWFVSKTCG